MPQLSRVSLGAICIIENLLLIVLFQRVSVLFFAVSAGGILVALATPTVIRMVGNYQAFMIVTCTMALSLIALVSLDAWAFTFGLFLHVGAIAAAEVSLSLYVLNQVPRRDLLRFGPWRMLFTISALTVGPFLGVFLQDRVGHNAPFVVSGLAVVGTLAYFHWLRLQGAVLR